MTIEYTQEFFAPVHRRVDDEVLEIERLTRLMSWEQKRGNTQGAVAYGSERDRRANDLAIWLHRLGIEEVRVNGGMWTNDVRFKRTGPMSGWAEQVIDAGQIAAEVLAEYNEDNVGEDELVAALREIEEGA